MTAGLIVAFLVGVCPAHASSVLSPDQQRTLTELDSLWIRNERATFWLQIDSELERLGPTKESRYAYELLSRCGRRRAALGQGRGAEPFLRMALTLAEAWNDSRGRCASLRWLGVALSSQGRKAEAHALWTCLLDLATETHDREHEAWAWAGLAHFDLWQGRPNEARSAYARSVAIFQKEGILWPEMFSLTGLGAALIELGDYDEALRCFRRAAAVGREQGWITIEAMASNDLGCLRYSLGDPGEAQRCFLRAYELQVQDGNMREAIIAGNNQALCENALGHDEEAVRVLEGLAGECRREGILELVGMVQNTIAEVRCRQGRHRLAARLYRSTLAMDESLRASNRVGALLGLSTQLAEMDSSFAAVTLLQAWTPRIRALEDLSLRTRFLTEMGYRLLDTGAAGAASSVLMEAEDEARRLGRSNLQWNALIPAVEAARALGMSDSALARARRAVAC